MSDKKGIVQIHGKDYVTVARRIELAREDKALDGVETEVLAHDPVVIRAKVTIKGKIFTGVSSVSLETAKVIEKQNPYEVAETSAVGRALGFAGYGVIEGIASADEMVKSGITNTEPIRESATITEQNITEETVTCEVCGSTAIERKGKTKAGKQYHGVFCSTENRSHTRWLWS